MLAHTGLTFLQVAHGGVHLAKYAKTRYLRKGSRAPTRGEDLLGGSSQDVARDFPARLP